MCTVCGCGEAAQFGFAPGHSHPHSGVGVHAKDHLHYGMQGAGVSVPGLSQARLIEVETDILSKNDLFAAANRAGLRALGVYAINLVSSPGSGKTSLLCRTIQMMGATPLAVIEGDQQTANDAERIRATGARAIQINTGKGCHLDADMVGHAMDHLSLQPGSYLFITRSAGRAGPRSLDRWSRATATGFPRSCRAARSRGRCRRGPRTSRRREACSPAAT